MGAVAAATRTGETLEARFRLGRHIGDDHVAEHYEATDLRTGEGVLVRTLRPELVLHRSSHTAFVGLPRQLMQRPLPHLARVLSMGTDATGVPFMVEERLRGRPLSELLREFPRGLSVADGALVISQVLDGLAHLHLSGLAHGQVEPARVIVTSQGERPLACLRQGSGSGVMDSAYRPPECRNRSEVSAEPHHDVFAVGVMMCHVWSGKVPSPGSAVAALERSLPELPRSVLTALGEALCTSEHKRIPDAASLWLRLEGPLGALARPISRPPLSTPPDEHDGRSQRAAREVAAARAAGLHSSMRPISQQGSEAVEASAMHSFDDEPTAPGGEVTRSRAPAAKVEVSAPPAEDARKATTEPCPAPVASQPPLEGTRSASGFPTSSQHPKPFGSAPHAAAQVDRGDVLGVHGEVARSAEAAEPTRAGDTPGAVGEADETEPGEASVRTELSAAFAALEPEEGQTVEPTPSSGLVRARAADAASPRKALPVRDLGDGMAAALHRAEAKAEAARRERTAPRNGKAEKARRAEALTDAQMARLVAMRDKGGERKWLRYVELLLLLLFFPALYKAVPWLTEPGALQAREVLGDRFTVAAVAFAVATVGVHAKLLAFNAKAKMMILKPVVYASSGVALSVTALVVIETALGGGAAGATGAAGGGMWGNVAGRAARLVLPAAASGFLFLGTFFGIFQGLSAVARSMPMAIVTWLMAALSGVTSYGVASATFMRRGAMGADGVMRQPGSALDLARGFSQAGAVDIADIDTSAVEVREQTQVGDGLQAEESIDDIIKQRNKDAAAFKQLENSMKALSP